MGSGPLVEPARVLAGRHGRPMPLSARTQVAEDHVVVKEEVCEGFIAKS